MAAERDRIVRNNSVANDIRLNLPVSVQMPDGEERLPYGRSGNNNPRLQLPCDYDPSSEIYRPYIKPPPNKTVCCTPDWEDSKHTSSNCTRGATAVNSQSVPKSSSSAHNSVWSSLSWSRSSKSPPSSSHTRHRNQQHQRHSHALNPSGSRHSSSSSSLSSTSSSGSKHKSFLGPLAVCSSLIDTSHSVGSSVQQRLQPVSSKEASTPSIAERLFGTTSTDKVTLQSQYTGNKTVVGTGVARTSPSNSNNNISPSSSSGVLSKLFDDPVSSSSSSKIRKGKKSGRMSLEPSQGENCFPAALSQVSQPSPTRVLASVVVKETSGAIVGDSCKAVDQYTAYNYPSSTSCDRTVRISSSDECLGTRCGNTANPDCSTESREVGLVGCGREINCQNNDNNGNSRTRVLSTDIGRHCDTTRLGEGKSDSNRIRDEEQEGDRGNNRSKNLHSTTDSSLYHLTHPGLIDSALLSESVKVNETAHQSELSDNSTPIQLSKQYCSTAEIASTSSICSSGQSKDVRSPRDVT